MMLPRPGKILIASSNVNFMTSLCEILSDFGYLTSGFTSLKDSLDSLKGRTFDVLLTDIDVQKNEETAFLKSALEADPSVMCILVTKQVKMHATLQTMKYGVFDYILKPFKIEVLLMIISRAIEVRNLRRERKFYSSIFENSADGICLLDLDGRVITANLPLARILGYESSDELVKNLSTSNRSIYTESDHGARIIQLLEDRETVSGIETEALCKDGSRIWISESLHAIRDKGGEILCCMGRIEDITVQKRNMNAPSKERDTRLHADRTEGDTDFLFEMIDDICESYKNLEELFLGFVTVVVNTLDDKSPWTKGHSMRVASYAEKIGREAGMDEEQIKKLRLAGLLHDIGRIGTLAPLFEKPTTLSKEEIEIIKKHPAEGAAILTRVNQLKDIVPYIRHHHERMDGRGYPDGLKGERIPFCARILHIAESFDSMTADRPYRPTPGREFAISEIRRCIGSQFDPQVSEVALKVL